MGLRRAGVYHKLERAYTRKSRKRSKSYIKAVPPKKTVKFTMGDVKKYNNKGYAYIVSLVSKEDAQIRDNALEASRQIIQRHLDRRFGKDYYFGLAVFPHHILREHKMAAGAQSDRTFAGMKHAFGKPLSLAAQLRTGQKIFVVGVNNLGAVSNVRKIFGMTRPKLGCSTSVVVEHIKK